MEADPICGIVAHTHEDSCFSTDGVPTCDTPEHAHDYACYPMPTTAPEDAPATEQEDLMAVPSDPVPTVDPSEEFPAAEEGQQYNADGDGTSTQVDLPVDTNVPEDAELTVTPIPEEDEQYAEMTQQIMDALPDTVAQVTLLDISFYDASGEYLSVSDTAQVDILFAEDMIGSGEVKVFHFVNGTAVELETVTVDRYAVSDEDGTESIQTQLAFETEGFSVFAVVSVLDIYDRITLTDPAQLAGNSYYIVSNNKNYIMQDSLHTNGNGLGGASYTDTDSLAGNTTWKFVAVGDGTYYILSSNGNYMVMEDSTGETAKVSLTTSKDSATKFTVRAINGQAEIGYDGPNGIAHYLNVYGGYQDFLGWHQDAVQDPGSKVYLHIAEDATAVHNLVTGLGGKSFAILSKNHPTALTTTAASVSGVNGLQSTKVSAYTVDGTDYVIGDIPLWTFTATDTAGVYYIHTTVDGESKYLTLASSGALTLSDTPKAITAASTTNGTVFLSVTENNTTVYINLYGGTETSNFRGYAGNDDGSRLRLCEKMTDLGLGYNLNAPSGASWINTPSISQAYQSVTTDGVDLQSVAGANIAGSFVDNTMSYRSDIRNFYNSYNTALGDSLTADNYLAPGAEYRFLGWQATVDGTSYLFSENATATLDSDGYIHIEDTDGTERTLPPNTTLTGQWKQVSDVVLFFVNYGDTMLETEESHDISGTSASLYTGIVAIGHLYNPVTIESGDTILKSNNDLIQAQIVPQYDSSNSDAQLVIDAVQKYNETTGSFEYVEAPNYNQTQLESSVCEYLQNYSGASTQIRIDNARVDRSEINPENYRLYLYAQKEVDDDGWHIDGVLVAKVYPTEIYKTFSGLTSEEAAAAIGSMTFPLSLIHTDNGIDEKDDYTTLTASSSRAGVYTNDGQQGTSNIYKWTLNAIMGQRYAFEETGYEVSKHDCSSLISVHYTDGTVKYHYNTDTTFDTTKDTPDLFADNPLVGGEVESVIFANFYTATGTGAFSVSKVQKGNQTNRLAGAKFTLTDSNGSTKYKTTNENGAAHFEDLAVGTYTLAETDAPTGYQSVTQKWTVQVSKDSDTGVVTVQIWPEGTSTASKTVYDSSKGGIQSVYLIENTPEDTTLTLTNYFSGISAGDLATLYSNSKEDGIDPYCIELQQKQTDGTYSTFKTVYLSEAQEMVGVVGYQWSITGVGTGEYRIVEKNYRHSGYADTVASATFNGTAVQITKDETAKTAYFTVSMTETADTLEITNTYTDTFQLKLQKVDSTTKDALSGAVFKIYSLDHAEATSGDTYVYVDAQGVTQTAYYVGQTTASGDDGIATFDGLKLSTETKTYVYVFEEFETPSGYVKLEQPVISSVTVGGTVGYSNGILTLEVENTPKTSATISVTAKQEWNVPWNNADCPEVTLTLYRQAGDTVEQVGNSVTLSANDTSQNTADGITVTADGWQVDWSGLPYTNDDGADYTYYVSAAPVPGYSTGYSNAVNALTVGSEQVQAAPALGSDLARSVTITNASGYELPEAGGIGTGWFTFIGLALILAAGLLMDHRLRRTRQAKPE